MNGEVQEWLCSQGRLKNSSPIKMLLWLISARWQNCKTVVHYFPVNHNGNAMNLCRRT